VASCTEHNNDNSRDVEYVRNILTTLWGVGRFGLELFDGKTKRSFDRSPALLNQTFSTMQTVFYEGQVTGAFRLDINRLQSVFKACTRAIHYNNKRLKHANWGIVMPGLMFMPEVPQTPRQNWARLCEMLQQVRFVRGSVPNPSIFEYGVAELQGNYVYCFVYYENFIVYALPLVDSRHNLTGPGAKS